MQSYFIKAAALRDITKVLEDKRAKLVQVSKSGMAPLTPDPCLCTSALDNRALTNLLSYQD